MNSDVLSAIQACCEELIHAEDLSSNIQEIYQRYSREYKAFKNISLLVGTNDLTASSFNLSILHAMDSKKFIDKRDNKEVIVNHPFSGYKNLLYLSPTFKTTPVIDSCVFVDSNGMNVIVDYAEKKDNSFIDFKLNNKLDLSFLPYMMEDYVNPYHENKKPEKTYEKIKIFETINNLDAFYYGYTGELRIDSNLLSAHGFDSLEKLLEDKFFFFAHFIDKKNAETIKLPNQTVTFMPKIGVKTFNFDYYFSEYFLSYGWVLRIVLEKYNSTTTDEKIEAIYNTMLRQGKILKQLIAFAYDYFENKNNVNRFFKFDPTWSSEEVLQTAKNIAWDIFLYLTSTLHLSNPRVNEHIKFDFGLPFFLTKDEKFFNSFVKHYSLQYVFLVQTPEGRIFYSFNTHNQATNEVERIIANVYNKDSALLHKKQKFHKLFANASYKHSMSLSFMKEMEHQISKKFM